MSTDGETERDPTEAGDPDISDEDRATVDTEALEEIADDVATETTSKADDSEETDDSDRDLDDLSGDITIGHVYCRGLGLSAVLARTQYGDDIEQDDREDLVDEYAGLAKQMDLDRYMDQWVREHGMGENVSPGAALVAFTGLFAVMVAVEDDAMLDTLAGEP